MSEFDSIEEELKFMADCSDDRGDSETSLMFVRYLAHIRKLNAELAALKAGQGEAVAWQARFIESAEVVGYRVSMPGEPELGTWLDEGAEDEPQIQHHEPLMTVAQHERIVAEITTPPATGVTMPSAHADVLAERRRQVEKEGWTPEHDDEHDDEHDTGTLATAAGCYAMHTLAYRAGDPPPAWPWDTTWWKPSPDRRRNLIKAGALILAEIERIDRAAEKVNL